MSFEEQLISLDGHLITVVRPFFGDQSDSWMGQFEVVKGNRMYQLITNNFSMIFRNDDVMEVQRTLSASSAPHPIAIIRLKGPKDYIPTRFETE